MAPRALWKGVIAIGELICPVALYTAVSNSERISFHIVNRRTGHRVRRQFIDSVTGEVVEADAQVKAHLEDDDRYVTLGSEDIAATRAESTKVIAVDRFIPCREVDEVYFGKPYFLGPAGPAAHETWALLRDALEANSAVGQASAVLFRKMRRLLIRAHDGGLIATVLRYENEVRDSREVFDEIPDVKLQKEMLDLAAHIIDTKRGRFDPEEFHDRYETALADLVQAKISGAPLPKRVEPKATNVVDLMEALRASAGAAAPEAKKSSRKPKATSRSGPAKTGARPARRAAG